MGLAEPHPHAVTPLGVFTVAAETLAVLAGSGGEAAAAVAPWTSGKLIIEPGSRRRKRAAVALALASLLLESVPSSPTWVSTR